MSNESKKSVVSKAITIWNTGDFKGLEECYSSNCLNHQHHHTTSSQTLRGPDSWKKLILEFRSAFPDYQLTVDSQYVDGNSVITRFTARGTQKGKLMGIDPTSKKVTISGIAIDRIENNKITETWVNWDLYGMLEQLGAISLHATH